MRVSFASRRLSIAFAFEQPSFVVEGKRREAMAINSPLRFKVGQRAILRGRITPDLERDLIQQSDEGGTAAGVAVPRRQVDRIEATKAHWQTGCLDARGQ